MDNSLTEKYSQATSQRTAAAISVAMIAEIAAVMIGLISLRTKKYSSMASGVILMAAATPMSQPCGSHFRRLRGIRSKATRTMMMMLICAKPLLRRTGSKMSTMPQISEAAAMTSLLTKGLLRCRFKAKASSRTTRPMSRLDRTIMMSPAMAWLNQSPASGTMTSAPKGG